jgi:hypothetical protein
MEQRMCRGQVRVMTRKSGNSLLPVGYGGHWPSQLDSNVHPARRQHATRDRQRHMSLIDRARARAHATIEKLPGKLGDAARRANEALGRPLANEAELADRRAFESRSPAAPAAAMPAKPQADAAPVIVYYMEKQKRDVSKLTDVLDANGITYTATNIQEDPAAQYAVKRDSKGIRLPVVFVAGDCLGGRTELVNAVSSGELKKKVFGG